MTYRRKNGIGHEGLGFKSVCIISARETGE